MKKNSRRIWAAITLCTMLISLALPETVHAESNEPHRLINLVYDDSGSMISKASGEKVDTWCQAKYAMEVFSALMGTNDTINVYTMSDFQNEEKSAPPQLVLNGSDGTSKNVGKVHDMLTPASYNTTFATVEAAYGDLLSANADEKWLIVLTDGVFNKPKMSQSDLEAYFNAKDDSVSVMFLGMGAEAAEINANEAKNIYFEKAQTSSDILSKLTGICTRIFNMNKLEVNASNGEFEFDIPMSQLIIFAQGADVKVESLTGPDSKKADGGGKGVGVKYSERACSNDDKNDRYGAPNLYDENLVGTLVPYDGEYAEGKYTVNAKNASTIEVYYKPNVDIMTYLKDADGNEIASNETVEPGDYTLGFGFVKAGTNDKVGTSSLLGNINYYASMTGTGADPDHLYTDGDKITLSEGTYTIDAHADFLKYNSVSTQMTMKVFKHTDVLIDVSGPDYYVNKDLKLKIDGIFSDTGYTKLEPTVLSLTIDGTEWSEAEWTNAENIVVEQIDNKDNRIQFDVVKTDTPGRYEITPQLKSGKTDVLGDYDNITLGITYNQSLTGEDRTAQIEYEVKITDLRPWYLKHLDKFIKLIVGGLLLLLFLGYTPLFKRRLPKTIKRAPEIRVKPNVPGRKKYTANGSFQKDLGSVIIPFRAEKGTISCIPFDADGAPPALRVKALDYRRSMDLVNVTEYQSYKSFSIDGEKITETTEKMRLTAGSEVRFVDRNGANTYTCIFNE